MVSGCFIVSSTIENRPTYGMEPLMVWSLLNPQEHGLGNGVAKAVARYAQQSAIL